MKYLKYLLLIPLILGIGYTIFKAPQLHKNYLRKHVGSSVVEVVKLDEAGNILGGGTGFSVKAPNGDKFIITNAHVCDMYKGKMAVIQLPNGELVFRNILKISPDTDLCLIENVNYLPSLSLAKETYVGQIIAIVGHPELLPLSISYGDMLMKIDQQIFLGVIGENITKEQCSQPKNKIVNAQSIWGPVDICLEVVPAYITTAFSLPGNSGSPVVDWTGKVTGVLFAGNDDTHWGLVIPLEDLRRFLETR
jgi:S1-C subfamily serine protease